MKKFAVTAALPVFITATVEAADEEEAVDKAYEFFSLTAFAGNGGTDKLVGVSESNVSIEAGESVIEASGFDIEANEI